MSLLKANLMRWPSVSDFFQDDWINTRFDGDFMPAVNVINNENDYRIEVAAPGFDKNDFNVAIENGVLSITGRKEQDKEEKTKNYTRKEFSRKSFTRSFTLPTNIDEDSIEAEYDDGVLDLTIKKLEPEAAARKEISIR